MESQNQIQRNNYEFEIKIESIKNALEKKYIEVMRFKKINDLISKDRIQDYSVGISIFTEKFFNV